MKKLKLYIDFYREYIWYSLFVFINLHRFCHIFCKNLANAGTPIEVIKRLARHESIETMMIYIDSSYEERMEALRKM
ncbi:site-specific integrase [Lentibacillus cibarius]|uniref:Site-specific integrase n=1 Tax=Lentibacillus cibarius TaxID=2583219 RepID=A0A549YFK6_9BACI|nr:tyrosine-type recombinase/integrase [Lentibacillus cibarius]TRM10672.1 site-specific integrase [Lentibacillus cibarius]